MNRPWVLISAYDLSTGASSEGHVAFNVLRHLCKRYRIVLITRQNNQARLRNDASFAAACPGVHLVGYDLPKWASWWKRGARFYQIYAYLWQMSWPLVVRSHTRLRDALGLVHVLNFHNDSIPSLAWSLGLPVVWGPVNHNELAPDWRLAFWPTGSAVRHIAAFAVRRVLWQVDPFLRLHASKSDLVISAGQWVDRRLHLSRVNAVIHRSQLGVSAADFFVLPRDAYCFRHDYIELICAGRLDWIKGLDVAIEALARLPTRYRLRIVGSGPAEAKLRALVWQLGVTARVVFEQAVARSALADLYARADIFVFTSAEAAGLAWVEALASGLPVVAFEGDTEVTLAARKLAGIHLVKQVDGRKAQIEGLAAAIEGAAVCPRDAIEVSAAALKYYGWDALAATIDQAYQAIFRHSE